MGARYEGYSGDLTRTIIVGEPDEQFRRIYDVVLRAMRHAEEVARPGMTGGESRRRRARGDLPRRATGTHFCMASGMASACKSTKGRARGRRPRRFVAPGMSLTIEPGIYLPEWGGVRIEDLVVFTRDRHHQSHRCARARCLTTFVMYKKRMCGSCTVLHT